jgi:hypothetical protein
VKNNRAVGRGLTLIVALVFTGLLNSCGSGAVSAPDPAAGTALSVFPGTADVFPDVPTTFTVSGGTPAYTIFSSNSVALPVTSAVSGSTFTIVPAAVSADTAVDITVRDTTNKSITARANVKPTTLINQVTFTPIAPTGTGCGTGLCSGGDAQVVVRAVLNGVVLRSRPIRFEVYQGSFQIVTPGTGILVNSLVVNTDEQGEAVIRITTPASIGTQTATLQFSDTASGLSRRFNFNIIQQTSGVGVLSSLPSGSITIKGAKGAAGQEGKCPVDRVDFYVYGGTPPYSIVSPLTSVASPLNSTAPTSGSGFGVRVDGCGTVSLIITDSKGLTIETAQIIAQQGDRGEAVSATTLTVAPTSVTVGCGQSASINLVGSGNFSTSIVTSGVNAAANSAGTFTISPTAGAIPSVVTFARSAGSVATPNTQPSSITVNVVAGATVTPVTVTTPASCP